MAKYSGQDVVLKREAPTSTWNDIGQVRSIGAVGSKRALIDASAHGDDWMDFLTGQAEGNEVPLVLEYDPDDTQGAALQADYVAKTSRQYRITHADSGADLVFPALITGVEFDPARTDIFAMNVTLKILNPGVEDFEAS